MSESADPSNHSADNATTRNPRVIIKSRRSLPFFHKHPWVFAGAIKRIEGSPAVGDVVDLYSGEGKFIARGLYNPASNIRVRLYAWEETADLNAEFWQQRVQTAANLRVMLFPHDDAGRPQSGIAYRAIYSESDGISGLTVDRYGDWLLVQFTSNALWQRKDDILPALQGVFQPQGIWLRTEKGIGDSEGLDVSDGLLSGVAPPRPLSVVENGVRFGADVVEGQKTGVFLDQRENRAAVARYTAGHRVLDVFCYTGGFGITALKVGNATRVTAIDASERALEQARATAELNGVGDRLTTIKSDAYTALEQLSEQQQQFETIILDPPRMTRQRSGVEKALRGYHSLNRLAVDLLVPGGILVTCSCSGLIDRQEFAGMLKDVSLRSGRTLQLLEIRGQAPDHPVTVNCPETGYLKCFICRVL